jgi:hypothetical protein
MAITPVVSGLVGGAAQIVPGMETVLGKRYFAKGSPASA